MKETKVYVDELPVNCEKCKYYTQFDNGMGCMITQELRPMDKQDNYTQLDCPLVDIKTHDRELVKEVCEKIRTMAHKIGKLVFCEHCYTTNSARTIDEHLLNEILGQIESEFEQKEYEK